MPYTGGQPTAFSTAALIFPMSIYNPGTRLGLIQALNEMRTYLAEDEQELRTLTDSAVYKLSRITDDAFEKLDLVPEFDT